MNRSCKSAEMPEPWRTAQDYLDTHGDQAEAEVQRLARELMDEGNAEDAEKLFYVYEAIKALRRADRKGGNRFH